jgi:hypothetical protein
MSATCRSCRAPIIWATNEKTGGRQPFDAAPDPDGRWELIDGEAGFIARYHKVDDAQVGLPGMPSAARYMPHHKSCPDAEQWRGKRR